MAKDICVISNFMSDKRKKMICDAAEKHGYSVNFFESREDAQGCIGECEVLYCGSPKQASEAVSAKWISTSWAGITPYLEPGIIPENCEVFTKGAGSYGVAISEHILMVALMLLKRYPEYLPHLEKHEWYGGLGIWAIHGSTVTVIGTGNIGETTAVKMKALGAEKVIGVNYRGLNPNGTFDEIYTFNDVEKALPETDILVLAAPDTEETRNMINRDRIAMLKETAIIVNVGRGTIIDQDALVEALNSCKIQGASLDVMVPEPLPEDHPLWSARNCIITPHISGSMTLEYTGDHQVEIFCENFERYVNGEELMYTVDFKSGY